MPYRSDIDGLRGIAVIAVMLFHFEVPGVTGGFAGVDVFFVISGFLITSFIRSELAAGSFSLGGFYERRIRRLFPALLSVVAFSWLAAAALFDAHDQRHFYQSAAATVLFAANFLFWKTTGYFDPSADTRPLLHTWSLSIEEQFYIVFPAILLLASRLAPRGTGWLLLVLAIPSFAASAVLAYSSPSAAYYLPLARFWELLLGAVLAFRPVSPPSSSGWRNAAGLCGLALIGYGVFFLSKETPFPGAAALAPCLGTALVIAAGTNGDSVANRLLGLRSLVFVGLISYSLYLWHWPLLVFTKYFLIRELNAPEKAALIALSILVATASWRYIERPFRGPRGKLSRTALFRTAGAASLLFVAIGTAGYVDRKAPATVQDIAAASRTLPLQRCLNRSASQVLSGDLCVLGAPTGSPPTFLLWGDSHGGALAPALDQAARRSGRSGLFAGQAGCLPLLVVERHDRHDLNCRAFNDAVAKLLERHTDIRTVVLAARWAMYVEGFRTEDPTRGAVLIAQGVDGNAGSFREGLEQSLKFLAGRKIEVVFVTQVPEIGWDVPSVVARSLALGRDLPPSPSLADYRARQAKVTDIVQETSRRLPLRVVDVSRTLCQQGACSFERDGQLLYLDSNHLNARGNELVSRAFAGVM
jgi:peptidoglycan/LPS O-acetylase OafA/YrhL